MIEIWEKDECITVGIKYHVSSGNKIQKTMLVTTIRINVNMNMKRM